MRKRLIFSITFTYNILELKNAWPSLQWGIVSHGDKKGTNGRSTLPAPKSLSWINSTRTFFSLSTLPEDWLSSFSYGCEQKAFVSERCVKIGAHRDIWKMVSFPYEAAKKKKKKKAKRKKGQQDFMVRQINKGYSELQVRYLASIYWWEWWTCLWHPRSTVMPPDIREGSFEKVIAVCSQMNPLRGKLQGWGTFPGELIS